MDSDYPYVSGTGTNEDCKYDKSMVKVNITGHEVVVANSVSQLKAAIEKGVVSVSVEADKPVFLQYESGILDSVKCGTVLDHAIAAVGYGTDKKSGKDYYIVRNSFSQWWGDQGYIKIAAVEGKGICGIQMKNSYP